MNTVTNALLVIHIIAGFIALGAGLVAAANKILDLSHRWHVLAGRTFFWSMLGIFCTAVPLSIITGNIFLLLIAVFSFYLAWSGWCYARNRSGTPGATDWSRAFAMLFASITMAIYGVYLLATPNNNGITMLVFAGIGGVLSFNDLRIVRAGGVMGTERIARHLTMMLAGTIATITAFLVVNVSFHPAYVVWLAPTVVITPVIIAMNFKVRSTAGRPPGARTGA